jgi:hypothetical protein
MASENRYTLKVRPGFESIVARHLQSRGLEVRIPEPEPGQVHAYVLCQSGVKNPQSMFNVPGVLCITSDCIPMV